MISDFSSVCVLSDCSIKQAISLINRNKKGIVLVVDEERRLIGTVNDGDIRRAVLAGIDLDSPVGLLLKMRESTPYKKPISAMVDTSESELLDLMIRHSVRQIPILDEEGRVMDLRLQADIVKEYTLPASAVVMAGGFGTRLRPLTYDTPKPMLPLGDRPILEHIIEQLHQAFVDLVQVRLVGVVDLPERRAFLFGQHHVGGDDHALLFLHLLAGGGRFGIACGIAAEGRMSEHQHTGEQCGGKVLWHDRDSLAWSGPVVECTR